MVSVVCVFVPHEAICLVYELSLLLLTHQDSSIDYLMFDFIIVFVMQEPDRPDRRLVSRHPVCVCVLPLTFINHPSSLSTLRVLA